MRQSRFEEMGYAKIDRDRKHRTGFAEVVFCRGGTNRMNIYWEFLKGYTKQKVKSLEQGQQSSNTSLFERIAECRLRSVVSHFED